MQEVLQEPQSSGFTQQGEEPVYRELERGDEALRAQRPDGPWQ